MQIHIQISYTDLKKLIKPLLLLLVAITIFSCKKTIVKPYEKESKVLLESFKITNTQEELFGSIDHSEKTITVTIPVGIYLTTIVPKLVITEKSKLKEGADSAITNLVEYFILGRKIEYPITAEDGTSVTYSLKIKTNQPPLSFHEVSKDPNKPEEFNQKLWFDSKQLIVYNNNKNYPYSKNYDLDFKLGQASLIDASGKEFKFEVMSTQTPPGIDQASTLLELNNIKGRFENKKYTETPPAGLYWVKIRYYDREEKLKNPIKITY